VAFLARRTGQEEPDTPLRLKQVAVFDTALSNAQIDELAHDKSIRECLDLEFTMDNTEYRSEFGQTCADLSEASSRGQGIAPGGCRRVAAMINCPVSCMHEIVPMCYDGMAPVPDATSPFGSITRSVKALNPKP